MTLDSFSMLNMQQCFFIFFCLGDTQSNVQSFMEKLLSSWKVSKNSLQPISTLRMLLQVFIFHLVKFVPSWQAVYCFITSVIFHCSHGGKILGKTERACECEWVKNKLSVEVLLIKLSCRIDPAGWKFRCTSV